MMDLIDVNIALQKWRGREKIHTHIIRTSWASVERPFFFLVVHPKLSAYTGKASLWKSLPKPPPSLPQASPKPPPSLPQASWTSWASVEKPPQASQPFPKHSQSLPQPPQASPKQSQAFPKPPQASPGIPARRTATCSVCMCVCVCECVCVCVCASLSGSLWANYIHN